MKEMWYHFKHKILPYYGAYLAKSLLHLIFKTCKVNIQGIEKFKSVAGKGPCILVLWHNRLAIAPEILSKYAGEYTYAALISQSRDGEILSTIVESYPIGKSIRVPHHDRLKALHTVIHQLKTEKDVIVITPDGPRGPKYKVKGGTIHAAKASGASIVPFSWTATRYWELNSWDKMQFPKPFSTITVSFDTPYQLEKNALSPTSEEISLVQDSIIRN